VDVAWLAALRLRPDAPVPIVFADGEPAAADTLVQAGVARQNKQRLTKEGIGAMLRAALQQRSERMSTGAAAQGKGASGQEPAPRVGIKGYRVLRKLGEGGMSQIFLAENARTGQVGALKVLTVTSGEITDLKLFIKEYDIISKLNSPYIVRIYDHGVADDHIFIAMEYLPGGNLKDRMSLGLGPNEALDILVQLGSRVRDILWVLVSANGQVVSKDELMNSVWPDTNVTEATLAQNIFAVRKALGEAHSIETVPKFGYRFLMAVREHRAAAQNIAIKSRAKARTVEPAPGYRGHLVRCLTGCKVTQFTQPRGPNCGKCQCRSEVH
jgi:DNA-binding winged helix-turn-helix (wHTH) protein